MFEFLIQCFSSLDSCKLFFFIPCALLVCGLIGIFLKFTRRSVVL